MDRRTLIPLIIMTSVIMAFISSGFALGLPQDEGRAPARVTLTLNEFLKRTAEVEVKGVLKTVSISKRIYSIDGIIIRLYGKSKILIKSDDGYEVVPEAGKVDKMARIIVNDGMGISVYDISKSGDSIKDLKFSHLKSNGSRSISTSYDLIYVSKTVKLAKDYKKSLAYVRDYGGRSSIANMSIGKPLGESLRRFIGAGARAGHSVFLVSGYRSVEKQRTLYNGRIQAFLNTGYSLERAKALAVKEVLPPGFSEHHTALAIDAVTASNQSLDSFVGSKAAKWFDNNSYKYGFIVRYPSKKTNITGIIYEPWHLRYVGSFYASYLKNKNMTLDEFYKKAQKGILIQVKDEYRFMAYKKNNDDANFHCKNSDLGKDIKKYLVSNDYTGYEIGLD